MDKEYIQKLAETHWLYVDQVIKLHCNDKKILESSRFHFISAFIHGYKHGYEKDKTLRERIYRPTEKDFVDMLAEEE